MRGPWALQAHESPAGVTIRAKQPSKLACAVTRGRNQAAVNPQGASLTAAGAMPHCPAEVAERSLEVKGLVLRAFQLDLCFLVDVTGSMAPSIAMVRWARLVCGALTLA